MKKCDCLLCSFENPKLCVTAIIVKDKQILVAKRNQAPFKNKWDFIGGYVSKNETPEEALERELKEELNVSGKFEFIGAFPGTASYKEFVFPVLNFAYKTELTGEIKLDTEENSEVKWVPLSEVKTIAFNSNQKILKHIKTPEFLKTL